MGLPMTEHLVNRRSLLTGLLASPALAALAFPALSNPAMDRSGFVKIAPMTLPPTAAEAPPLAAIAEGGARYFGAAVRMDQLSVDAALRGVVLRDCSRLTPEYHLNWTSIEWNKGEYSFEPIDQLVSFAAAHGMKVRGHTLVWDQSTPDWAKAEMNSQRDWGLVANYFARVLGRYGDQIGEWNVVNEAIDTEAGDDGMRRTTFQRAFGSDYVERALREARLNAPGARLHINDYGFEYDNPVDASRRAAFLALVRRLKERDAPLDSVGLQAHLDLSKGPIAERALAGFMRDLAASGVDITITELDVKEQDHDAPVDVRDQRVAEEAQRFLDVALAEPAVQGLVTWGLSDKHSWLTENPTQAVKGPDGDYILNRGLPYDQQCQPKPMYWAVWKALRATSTPALASRRARDHDASVAQIDA